MATMSTAAATLLPDPGEPAPILLMNTIWADRTGTHDALTTTAELSAWLEAVGSRLFAGGERAAGAVRRSDVAEFRRLRDALRRLAADVTHDPREHAVRPGPFDGVPDAAVVVNTASAAAPAVPTLQVPGWEVESRPALGARAPVVALSAVAGLAVALFGGPDREALRACLAPGCVLYFVKDHPRREWCSAACGNRARAARHYARHRSGPAD